MAGLRWNGVGVVDVLYVATMTGALALGRYETATGAGMGLFAVFILLVDWYETRQIENKLTTHRRLVALLGLTLLVLGVWAGLATRGPTELATFFALTAGFFFLVAIRETVILDLTPVELILEGYVSLVAIYLVLGAATDAIDRYQGALVVLAVGIYVGRNIMWWTSAALGRLAGDAGTQ
jgi:hypothetical protein